MRPAIVGTILALSVASTASTAGATSQPPEFGGEELFMGLFLDQGPVAQAFPDLKGPHSGVRWTPREAQDLTARMKRLDPAFFATFKADITSGDRIRVSRASDAAGQLAARASIGGTGGVTSPQGAFMVVDRTVMKQSHVVVNRNKYWHGPDPGSSELAQERWADDVAEQLAR
ncbi:hypothetical protein [Nonomuraea jabiensis]|uniref:hypothetical protein n=1 Tax=Nonomuraea jabiensis TaxID=882448 RepID=UPI0036743943